MTLQSPVALLNDAALQAPERTAYVCGDVSLTYAEALFAAAALRADLAARGCAGRPVVLFLPNSIGICLYTFAIQSAGGMSCTVNPAYTARELSLVLADAAPRLVVCRQEGEETVRAALPRGSDADILVLPEGEKAWLAALGRGQGPLPVPDGETIGTLQYTGGTSGRPKGVLLSHAAVARNVEQREEALPTIRGDERVLCVMPLFHVFAQSMCLHLSVMAQGTLHILPRYRPDFVLDAIERQGITRFPAGPTVFNGLLGYEGFEARDFSSLRCAYSGSAPLSKATLERWRKVTSCEIYEGYGQTEAGPILTFNRPGLPVRPGTVGVPVADTEIRIADLDDPAEDARPGEAGEVLARGPQIMTGYLGLPEETGATLQSGWLHTGDIGRLDEAGYLVIEDRRKDMALIGGFNVYPREIDEVLMAHEDVAEAAVIGVPDDYRGEKLVAHVVLRPGAHADEAALAGWCRANLVKYKVPSVFVLSASLPRTPAQKIDKKALKEEAMRSHVA